MFCPYCGKECTDGVKFCPHCGKTTEGGQVAKSVTPKTPSPASKKPKKEKKPMDLCKVKKLLGKGVMVTVIAFVLSVLVAGGSIAHFFLAPQALSGEKITPPPVAEISDPTYDTDAIEQQKVSGKVSLGEPATDEEMSELNSACDAVSSAIAAGIGVADAEYGGVTEENQWQYLNAVSGEMSALYWEDVIRDYDVSDNCVDVELYGGIHYIYLPYIEGYDAGDKPLLEIGTYQPYENDYGSDFSSMMTYPDDGAKAIAKALPLYSFVDANNLNNQDITLDSLINMANYNVILWHGHGGYSYDVGPFLGTRIVSNAANDKIYYELLSEGSLVKLSSGHYGVTAYFFEKYLPENSLDNTVVYLGTCESGRTSELADAFLEKGAEAVYANSRSIRTKYNLAMIKSVAEGLSTQYDNGAFYTVRDALVYAKDKNGDRDSKGKDAETLLFTNNENFALDWYEDHMIAEREVVLVLDKSGSMDGQPMNETKEAAKGFVEKVIDQKAVVSVVAYSDNAYTLSEFTRRKAALTGAIDNLYCGGGTNVDAGLTAAYEKLKDSDAKKRIIILMSDGVANEGRVGDELTAFADDIRKDGIYIYSLGFFHSLYGSELGAAQETMGKIADPGRHFEIKDAKDVVYAFDDLADQISGERVIYIRIACPVDVKVTYKGETLSKKNPRTSFGTISFENAVDEDGMEEEYDEDSKVDNRIKTLRLKEGVDYEVEIEGTDKGKMDYTIGFMDENGEYSDMRTFENVKITKKTTINTVAAYTTMTKLDVDEDGDGEVDFYYVATVGEEGEKTEVVFPWQLTVAIIFGSAAIFFLLLFILFIVFLNKTKQKMELSAN